MHATQFCPLATYDSANLLSLAGSFQGPAGLCTLPQCRHLALSRPGQNQRPRTSGLESDSQTGLWLESGGGGRACLLWLPDPTLPSSQGLFTVWSSPSGITWDLLDSQTPELLTWTPEGQGSKVCVWRDLGGYMRSWVFLKTFSASWLDHWDPPLPQDGDSTHGGSQLRLWLTDVQRPWQAPSDRTLSPGPRASRPATP